MSSKKKGNTRIINIILNKNNKIRVLFKMNGQKERHSWYAYLGEDLVLLIYGDQDKGVYHQYVNLEN